MRPRREAIAYCEAPGGPFPQRIPYMETMTVFSPESPKRPAHAWPAVAALRNQA